MSWRARLHQLRSRIKLRACSSVGAAPSVEGRVWIHGKGRITIGHRVRIDAGLAPVELNAAEGAEIVIGDDVQVNSGVSIEACGRVDIGERCRLERFCKIIDTHFHPTALGARRERRPDPVPVVVEPDSEIGCRAILLPGAFVRRGATVRPATVVRTAPAAALRRPRPEA